MIEDHGLEVDLQITNRCPLTCDHCVYDSSMAESAGLPGEVIDRLCREFEELNVGQVSITGGEPFIRKDLLEVISNISSRGIETCVQTSGLLVDRVDFGALSASGLDLLLVSIDGLPDYHDKFRHRHGTFSDACRMVEKAREHDIPVRINTVVTRSNIGEVVELLPVARRIGVGVHSFFYFSPLGRGSGHPGEVLSFSEWSVFEQSVRNWCTEHPSDRHMGVKIQNVAVPAASIPPEGQHCRIKDRDNVLILANGDVYPCVFVCHRPELCLGNVLDRSLTDIWMRSEAWTTRYDPFFPNKGTDCGGAVPSCSGGCPAMRDVMRTNGGFCDRRCEWSASALVPGCAREYVKIQ